MNPQTTQELHILLVQGQMIRLYGELAAAARRGPLTEDAIARIEDSALDFLRAPGNYASEFPDFDAHAVTAAVHKDIQDLLSKIRAVRVKSFTKEH